MISDPTLLPRFIIISICESLILTKASSAATKKLLIRIIIQVMSHGAMYTMRYKIDYMYSNILFF